MTLFKVQTFYNPPSLQHNPLSSLVLPGKHEEEKDVDEREEEDDDNEEDDEDSDTDTESEMKVRASSLLQFSK